MDCQSGCPLKSVSFAYFPAADPGSVCPAQGSALMWALMWLVWPRTNRPARAGGQGHGLRRQPGQIQKPRGRVACDHSDYMLRIRLCHSACPRRGASSAVTPAFPFHQ